MQIIKGYKTFIDIVGLQSVKQTDDSGRHAYFLGNAHIDNAVGVNFLLIMAFQRLAAFNAVIDAFKENLILFIEKK